MFDLVDTESLGGAENVCDIEDAMTNTADDLGCSPSRDSFGMESSHGVSFGRTGDAAFDDLMDRVDQFNVETRQLTELARQEIAAKASVQDVSPFASSTYTYNTGDAHLDNLLNDVQRGISEYQVLADQARMELGPGKYLSIDDAINRGGSQGLSDYIQQQLDWMDHATPEQLRQYEHQVNWQHEVEMARAHEHQVLVEKGEIERAAISDMTPEQYRTVERLGLDKIDATGLYPRVTTDFTDGRDLYKVDFDGKAYKIVNGIKYEV